MRGKIIIVLVIIICILKVEVLASVYTVPQHIRVCPVCLLADYIIVEQTSNGIIAVRCANMAHVNMVVVTGGVTYQEAIYNWNNRGKIEYGQQKFY